MNDLAQRLHDGVPEAPALDGLAVRAEGLARRSRGRRRGLAVSGVVAATLVAASLPRFLAPTDDVATAPSPPITPATSAPTCVQPTAVDHDDVTVGRVAWVAFCSPGGSRAAALVSDAVLTDGAAELVAGWRDGARPDTGAGCAEPREATAYSIQVGFTDGTVAGISGASPRGCPPQLPGAGMLGSDPYVDLMTALGAQALASSATTDAEVAACPEQPQWLVLPEADTAGLARSVAADGRLCRYVDGALSRSQDLAGPDAEAVRLAALSSFRPTFTPRSGCEAEGRSVLAVIRTGVGEFVVHVADPACDRVAVGAYGGPLQILGVPGHRLRKVVASVSGPS